MQSSAQSFKMEQQSRQAKRNPPTAERRQGGRTNGSGGGGCTFETAKQARSEKQECEAILRASSVFCAVSCCNKTNMACALVQSKSVFCFFVLLWPSRSRMFAWDGCWRSSGIFVFSLHSFAVEQHHPVTMPAGLPFFVPRRLSLNRDRKTAHTCSRRNTTANPMGAAECRGRL